MLSKSKNKNTWFFSSGEAFWDSKSHSYKQVKKSNEWRVSVKENGIDKNYFVTAENKKQAIAKAIESGIGHGDQTTSDKKADNMVEDREAEEIIIGQVIPIVSVKMNDNLAEMLDKEFMKSLEGQTIETIIDSISAKLRGQEFKTPISIESLAGINFNVGKNILEHKFALEKADKYVCPDCGVKYYNSRNMVLHMMEEHDYDSSVMNLFTNVPTEEAVNPEEILYDFLDINPSGNGEDALAYMTSHGVGDDVARKTITKYGKTKENFKFNPINSPLTIVELMKYGLETKVKPDVIIVELLNTGVSHSTIAKALAIMNAKESDQPLYKRINHADLIKRVKAMQSQNPDGRLTHEQAIRIAHVYGIKENDVYRVLGYHGESRTEDAKLALLDELQKEAKQKYDDYENLDNDKYDVNKSMQLHKKWLDARNKFRELKDKVLYGEAIESEIPKGYKKCPRCLHGWMRDVGPNSEDMECPYCDATGFVKESKNDTRTCSQCGRQFDKSKIDHCPNCGKLDGTYGGRSKTKEGSSEPCHLCRGVGSLQDSKCPHCKGSGNESRAKEGGGFPVCPKCGSDDVPDNSNPYLGAHYTPDEIDRKTGDQKMKCNNCGARFTRREYYATADESKSTEHDWRLAWDSLTQNAQDKLDEIGVGRAEWEEADQDERMKMESEAGLESRITERIPDAMDHVLIALLENGPDIVSYSDMKRLTKYNEAIGLGYVTSKEKGMLDFAFSLTPKGRAEAKKRLSTLNESRASETDGEAIRKIMYNILEKTPNISRDDMISAVMLKGNFRWMEVESEVDDALAHSAARSTEISFDSTGKRIPRDASKPPPEHFQQIRKEKTDDEQRREGKVKWNGKWYYKHELMQKAEDFIRRDFNKHVNDLHREGHDDVSDWEIIEAILVDHNMHHIFKAKIGGRGVESRATESSVSWDVDGSTSQTNADRQFAQLIPIYNGKMKASFKNTQDGSFSFFAEFAKSSDAKEWADNLKDMDDLGVKNIKVS